MIEIPSFICKSGCGKCCTTTPVSLEEAVAISKFTGEPAKVITIEIEIHGVKTMITHTDFNEHNECVYLGPFKECRIYPVRPLMCRLFGNVDTKMLTCPEGCGPEKKLTDREAEMLAIESDALTAIVRQWDPKQGD